MKKFYYKKNVPIDKTPIMRLERRHTVNANKDAMEEEQRRLSTRSTSVDRLADAPCVSKLKDREITKCLSEDVLSKGHLKNSTKIITERELSASWLYKTRKASMNSKISPQKIPQPADMSPVILNDPNLKPVPVESKNRNKNNSSCLCYFAIMMAISFCTVGFLAGVAGFLYSEIFPDKNSTLHQAQDSMVDVRNLTEEVKSKSNTTYGFRILSDETLKIAFDSGDYRLDKRRGSVSNETESEKLDTVHLGKLDVTDLSQFLDNRKAEIKFQDGDTIIYEMNSSNSIKQEESINIPNNIEMLEIENNLNKTRESKVKDITERTDGVMEEKINKDVDIEESLTPQPNNLNVSLTGNNENQDIFSSIAELKNDLIMSRSNLEDQFESQVTSTESNEFETTVMEESKSSSSSPEIQDAIPVKDHNESVSLLEVSDAIKWKVDDKVINHKQESGVEHHEEIVPISENTELQSESDHGIESMLMEVNEPPEEPQDAVFMNRNGEIMPLAESSDFEPTHNADSDMLKRDDETVMSVSTEPQNLEHLESKQPLRIKPLDMKVTLAEAMKHLQALDVNNKLLTSRIKPVKFKPQNTKPEKLVHKPRNNQNISNEKMQYLKNLRLALQGNLQRT